jgi:CelD/BcsL family acetyltransferase involved in cellulose biosynthesis
LPCLDEVFRLTIDNFMGQVRILTRLEELEAIASDWRSLSSHKLTRSWEFLRCWLEHFPCRDSLRILVSESNGRVDGILPLVEERRLWTGRTLVNAGSGKACLDDLGLIADPSNVVEIAKGFVDYLLRTPDLHWDYLRLEGIRTEDPGMRAFAEEFTRNYANAVERRSDHSCWAIDLHPDQDGNHSWSKRLRSLMRKAREEHRRGELEFHIASNIHDALTDLDVMESIHQARWQGRGIDGCFSSEPFANFTKDLLKESFEAGTVFVAILRWKGNPAAGAICFQDSETLYVYLASMSSDFPKEKPGWKLNGYLADYALRQGCKRLDLMRGDEEYKQRMGAIPYKQEKWMIASPRFWGRLHRTLYRTAREIKHFMSMPSATLPTPEAAIN